MLTIDGSSGEGGGQILRSSLALSAITATPFRIERIRAGRKQPGLRRQHLTAVRAAATVCEAEVEGDEVGSGEVVFRPGAVQPGDYRFAIGTAGSTTLVLQTVLPALLTASGRSTIVLEGGTHNPFAPPFDFLAKTYVPLVRRMGADVAVELERPGFFPAGGGRLRVVIEPAAELQGIELLERGKTVARHARAIVASLPRHIAEREVKVLQKRLGWPPGGFSVEEISDSAGPGNIVIAEIETEAVCEVISSVGQVRRPAESVAAEVARECRRYLKSTAPVGEHLTDQLLLPLALAGSGRFRSVGLSRHATTHIELIRQFLALKIGVEETGSDGVIVSIGRVRRLRAKGTRDDPPSAL